MTMNPLDRLEGLLGEIAEKAGEAALCISDFRLQQHRANAAQQSRFVHLTEENGRLQDKIAEMRERELRDNRKRDPKEVLQAGFNIGAFIEGMNKNDSTGKTE
jgi:hypothetical protein